MMFREVSIATYNYIIQLELTFFQNYKVDAVRLFSDLTLLDLDSYVSAFQKRLEKENKEMSKRDVVKSLIAVRNILMNLNLGD